MIVNVNVLCDLDLPAVSEPRGYVCPFKVTEIFLQNFLEVYSFTLHQSDLTFSISLWTRIFWKFFVSLQDYKPALSVVYKRWAHLSQHQLLPASAARHRFAQRSEIGLLLLCFLQRNFNTETLAVCSSRDCPFCLL
jgi:hypothetical protein